MAEELTGNAAEVLRGTGRHWGWPLAYGIITLAIGVVVLIWPDRTVEVVAVLFGIQLLVAGVFRFVGAIAAEGEGGGTRVLLALLGVLCFIAGLYDCGVPLHEAHAYAEGVRRGGAVVAVAADDEVGANQAAVIMSRNGALDIDKCAEGWKRQGWRGRLRSEPAIEVETYVLVFGEYPAGAGRVYVNRRLTRRAA